MANHSSNSDNSDNSNNGNNSNNTNNSLVSRPGFSCLWVAAFHVVVEGFAEVSMEFH